jgi:hypothetical protein
MLFIEKKMAKLYIPSTPNNAVMYFPPIQMKLILLCVWAELAVLGSTKTALKLKYEILIHCCIKCPQILREKTSSQNSQGIAFIIQWHFFIKIRWHQEIDFAGNTCRI